MKEYVLIFRMDLTSPESQPSQEQLDGYMVSWSRWLDGITGQAQLIDGGNHFSKDGYVVRKGTVTATPYVANRESVAGYITIAAPHLDSAIAIATACPILDGSHTSVEVREIGSPGTA